MPLIIQNYKYIRHKYTSADFWRWAQ